MPIPAGYSRLERMSAKERVFLQIQRWIVDGTLQPGEQLHDGELAEALGVSRTPVREALQTLEIQGFVEMHRGRDTRVTTITKDETLKIYPPLASLQSLAAETATNLMAVEHTEHLKAINRQFVSALDHREFYQAMEIDDEFHNLIVDLADNPYITTLISTLQLHVRRLKYVFFQDALLSHTSATEHSQIIEAFEQKDSHTAAEVMKLNWMRLMNQLSRNLESSSAMN